ncbi:MAG TPA: DUF4010 domain-containing protein [Gemmatimonadaceae bacterium]|nr:DUF4010 domain-containing protein [Gemmatimonadaceae bacterium]
MPTSSPLWPYLPTLARLALALALGLFIGLERERRGKEAGLRTFAFAAVLGAVGGLLGERFALLALGLLGVLVVLLNIETIRTGEGAEITTSGALLVTGFIGVLAGLGHAFTPTALGVATAALLAWKEPLAGFSRALTAGELRSAILLAILAFVVYPVLPTGSLDPWSLVEPRAAWVTVILIAALGFTNYVLLKLYGTRGIALAGFLGGLVNSTVTVTELAMRFRESNGRFHGVAYRGVMLATAAMLVRNAILLALLAPATLLAGSVSFVLMLGVACALAWKSPSEDRSNGPDDSPLGGPDASPTTPADGRTDVGQTVGLASPFSLSVALKYGVIFLVLQVAGTLAERGAGELGFYGVSALGGLVSSASAVAAAANLARAGTTSIGVAATGAVIASVTSVLVNWPLAWRVGKDRRLAHRLLWGLASVGVAGVIGELARFGWTRLG